MTKRVEAVIAGAYLSGTNTRRVRRALGALFKGAVGKVMLSVEPGGRCRRAPDIRGRQGGHQADWHTLAIAGGDIAVAQAVTRQRAFVASSQGDIGRRLVQLLMDAGCEDVEVEAEVLLLRDLGTASFALHIRSTLEAIISNGAITRDAGEQWWEAVQELDARGQFFASVTAVICGGTVQVSEENGFPSRAPKVRAVRPPPLKRPALAKSGRTVLLNARITQRAHDRFHEIVEAERQRYETGELMHRATLGEIVERALAALERELRQGSRDKMTWPLRGKTLL